MVTLQRSPITGPFSYYLGDFLDSTNAISMNTSADLLRSQSEAAEPSCSSAVQQKSYVHAGKPGSVFLVRVMSTAMWALQVVRKPEEGDFIGHLRAEGLMEIARIFQVCQLSFDSPSV